VKKIAACFVLALAFAAVASPVVSNHQGSAGSAQDLMHSLQNGPTLPPCNPNLGPCPPPPGN
jgi:hypothetical protein